MRFGRKRCCSCPLNGRRGERGLSKHTTTGRAVSPKNANAGNRLRAVLSAAHTQNNVSQCRSAIERLTTRCTQ